jgi:(S)-mandelate dehydrogenase
MVDRGPAEKTTNGAAARLRQRFPTIDDLRRRARRRVPRFGLDFVDGGANEEYCTARNTSAFQAIELLPHYCIDGTVTTGTELFGRTYAAPIGIAPMGSAGLMWPGGEKLFAAEAQRQRIPYVSAASVLR